MRDLWQRARVILAGVAIGACGAVSATPISGLQDDVQVLTPETGIPSIVARNEHDLYFMQGYLHARDRFFQMDFTRRLISGTLAELVGPNALPSDIQLRTLGMRRAAWESFAASSPEVRAALQGYANGVNAWLANNPLPTEYGALELSQAERWAPVDSLAVGKALAFQLSFSLDDIDNTIALGTMQQVGQAAGFDGTALFTQDLYRVAPPDDRVTVPGFIDSIGGIGQVPAAKTDHSELPQVSPQQLALATRFRETMRNATYAERVTNARIDDRGSNWWIASGDITDSGNPILANDPHLALDIASVFVPNHIAVPGTVNVAGVGVPGAPGIIQGCTETMCWGSTVNPIDATDAYFEEVVLNTYGVPKATVYQGQQERIVWLFQNYFVNQVGDEQMDNLVDANVGLASGAITFIVPRRNNGPILDIDGNTAISVQHTGFGATLELESFYEMNRAATVFDGRDALTKFDFGSQNFGMADTAGNIGYIAAAEVPVRTDLQTLNAPDGGVPPIFIRDGTGELMHEWMSVNNPQTNQALRYEILPQSEMPQSFNPASGFIVNANNDPVGVTLDNNAFNQVRPQGGLYYLDAGYSSYRMGRADRLMKAAVAAGPVTRAQMTAWQGNNQLLDAEIVMPYILQAIGNAQDPEAWPGLQQFLADPRLPLINALMAGWDFSTPTGITEGYDPGDNPLALGAPSADEVNASVAATIFSVWRSRFIANTIDGTLDGIDQMIGQPTLGPVRPGSRLTWNAAVNLLQSFNTNQGVGVSGIPFFNVPDAPTPADARDFIILGSLAQALALLASDEFAPAFGNSQDPMDYRWGKLHRIVFDHPLGAPLSIPNGAFGFSTVDGLPGIPRSGGYQVLDASSHSVRADGLNEFMFGSGPARRFVGELTPRGVDAEQIIPGGQSGDIASQALYVNQLPLWLTNNYLPLLIDPAVVDAVAVGRQTFTPSRD